MGIKKERKRERGVDEGVVFCHLSGDSGSGGDGDGGPQEDDDDDADEEEAEEEAVAGMFVAAWQNTFVPLFERWATGIGARECPHVAGSKAKKRGDIVSLVSAANPCHQPSCGQQAIPFFLFHSPALLFPSPFTLTRE